MKGIEPPKPFTLYGNRYYAVDDLIDYNLDKYIVIKRRYDRIVNSMFKFCKSIEHDEFVSEKQRKEGLKYMGTVIALEHAISELKKEFLYLVKVKNAGYPYYKILDKKSQ